MRKYASFGILEAKIAQLGATPAMMRTAHRATFNYEPQEGYLYVRSRAISSRCNDNYDEFPADEIRKAWRTFIGKPVFVNHHNEDHRRARGVIIDAALHEDVLPDGLPDTWVEVLMEVDAIRFPMLAKAILAGDVERTSMGTDCAYSVCSACGNVAKTAMDYCAHVPRMKGMKHRRVNASTGSSEEVLIREICYGLSFFENSLLVEDPADPTAFVLGVDDRGVGGGYTGGMAKAASRKVTGVNPDFTCFPMTMVDLGVPEDEVAAACRAEGWSGGGIPVADALHIAEQFLGRRSRASVLPSGTTARTDETLRSGTWLIVTPGHIFGMQDGRVAGPGAGHMDEPIQFAVEYPDAPRIPSAPIHASRQAAADPVITSALNHYGTPTGGVESYRTTDYHGDEYGVHRTASRRHAIGEVSAPTEVDTLRDESCPICGEIDSFDGEGCNFCLYQKPPDSFMDPDLELAQEVDLRQSENPGSDVTMADPDGDGDGDFFVEGDDDDSDEEDSDGDGPERVVPDDLVLEKPKEDPPDSADDSSEAEDSDDEAGEDPFELEGDSTSGDDGDDEGDDDENPVDDKDSPKKDQKSNKRSTLMRPALRAIAELEAKSASQQAQIDMIAGLAGVSDRTNRIKAGQARQAQRRMRRRADLDNPAQPVPEPAPEAPYQTTEDALGNVNRRAPGGGSLPDEVYEIGDTSETDVEADARVNLTDPTIAARRRAAQRRRAQARRRAASGSGGDLDYFAYGERMAKQFLDDEDAEAYIESFARRHGEDAAEAFRAGVESQRTAVRRTQGRRAGSQPARRRQATLKTADYTISSNGFSTDQQASDALDWMRLNHPAAYSEIRKHFTENIVWSENGSWFDTEAMGVDQEWGSWLIDAIEATGLVYWEEGEPWAATGKTAASRRRAAQGRRGRQARPAQRRATRRHATDAPRNGEPIADESGQAVSGLPSVDEVVPDDEPFTDPVATAARRRPVRARRHTASGHYGGDTWETGEVLLVAENDYGLYTRYTADGGGSFSRADIEDFKQDFETSYYEDGFDWSEVDWDVVERFFNERTASRKVTASALDPEDIPDDFSVRPLRDGENPPGKTTCGTCGLSWDDDVPTSWTPAPGGRCPFEYFHLYDEDYTASRRAQARRASQGGGMRAGRRPAPARGRRPVRATRRKLAEAPVLDEALTLEDQDVTKPVSGTTEQRPTDEVRIETEVVLDEQAQRSTETMGNGLLPEPQKVSSSDEGRTFASLRLARLRISAGIAQGDDIALGQSIAKSSMSDSTIAHEISTLEMVSQTAARTAERNLGGGRLVPRTASAARAVPSFASPSLTTTASSSGEDAFLFE